MIAAPHRGRPRHLANPEREGTKEDIRVISNLVTSDIPIRDEGVVSISERSVVSHGRSASIGVSTLGEELIDGIQGI